MKIPCVRTLILISLLATLAVAGSLAWYEIDRSAPFRYEAAFFDRAEAAPGETVNLTLRLRWPRRNCSTRLERTFIGSDKQVYKTYTADGKTTVQLGPPPAQAFGPDNIVVSTRPVTLPAEIPQGVAIHSPNVWMRCTSPAHKWGDYLTELWPIFIGPKGAQAKITIKRPD